MRFVHDWRRIVAAAVAAWLVGGCSGSPPHPPAEPPPLPASPGEAALEARYLEALLRRQPRHWRARVRLANLASAAGRDQDAFNLLRAASADSPGNLGLYAALAEAAEGANHLDWALYGWRQLIRRSPADPLPRVRLAQFYRRLGWQQDAAGQLAVAVDLVPDALAVLRERASFAVGSGSPADARLLAARLVKQFPQTPYGYSLLADLAAESGRWREAVSYGRAAVERAPRDEAYLVRLAQYELTRSDTPDPQAALRALDQALAIAPESPAAHYWRGGALRRLGQAEGALREMERVYQADPNYAAVTLQLAELCRATGNPRRADTLLEQYTRIQAESRRRQEALSHLAVRPLSAAAHLRMAQAYLEAGEAGPALLEFLTAQRLEPGLQAAREGVLQALKHQGREPASLAPLTG